METVVQLEAITPDAETRIMRDARISSSNRNSDNPGLLRYLIRHGHWSPFEMANVNIYVECPRAIARQILRHRSFSFQEFSQRYAEVQSIPFIWRARTEHARNRQSSVETDNAELHEQFTEMQHKVWDCAMTCYVQAIEMGIAREQARALLPEGLTRTCMCINGSIRSWIHYVNLRCQQDTQLEHREIAVAIRSILCRELPNIASACGWTD